MAFLAGYESRRVDNRGRRHRSSVARFRSFFQVVVTSSISTSAVTVATGIATTAERRQGRKLQIAKGRQEATADVAARITTAGRLTTTGRLFLTTTSRLFLTTTSRLFLTTTSVATTAERRQGRKLQIAKGRQEATADVAARITTAGRLTTTGKALPRKPHEGAASQSQALQPPPSTLSSNPPAKLWPQRPRLRTSAPIIMFHFIELRLLNLNCLTGVSYIGQVQEAIAYATCLHQAAFRLAPLFPRARPR